MRLRHILLIIGVLLPLGNPIYAVPADSTIHSPVPPHDSTLSPQHEFTLWAGFGFDSYALWGKTPDTRTQSIGLGYNRKLIAIHHAVLEYNLRVDLYSNYSYPAFSDNRKRISLSGLGVAPLGFQLNFLSRKPVQPFLNTSAGITFLDTPFPNFRGEKLNFTFSAGGGLEMRISSSVSLSLGVKYHHLSNGDRGQVNPGIDSNIYYTSITIF